MGLWGLCTDRLEWFGAALREGSGFPGVQEIGNGSSLTNSTPYSLLKFHARARLPIYHEQQLPFDMSVNMHILLIRTYIILIYLYNRTARKKKKERTSMRLFPPDGLTGQQGVSWLMNRSCRPLLPVDPSPGQ